MVEKCNEIRKTLLQLPLSKDSNINCPYYSSQIETLLAKHTAQTV